jgi:hypothetical protein
MHESMSDHIQAHRKDIESLAGVTQPDHVLLNEVAQRFRRSKYRLKMRDYSFRLLQQQLQDDHMYLLSIINQHMDIKTMTGAAIDPSEISGGILGVSTDESTFPYRNGRRRLWSPSAHTSLKPLQSLKSMRSESIGESLTILIPHYERMMERDQSRWRWTAIKARYGGVFRCGGMDGPLTLGTTLWNR